MSDKLTVDDVVRLRVRFWADDLVNDEIRALCDALLLSQQAVASAVLLCDNLERLLTTPPVAHALTVVEAVQKWRADFRAALLGSLPARPEKP